MSARLEKILYFGVFVICLALMWKTFSVSGGRLQIASKAWSDFAATIPLTRSFSIGYNFPPEYPIFAGQPIKYHFVFYALVGLLEKVGFPLDWALNISSAAGMTLMFIMIYVLSKTVFKDRAVGVLGIIFTLLNGSFSFIEFFRTHPLNTSTISQIIQNRDFSSFGPYDGKTVSAFWNLNIFTNQRHLGFAYFFFLLLVYFLITLSIKPERFDKRAIILIAVLVGVFPFIHSAVFGMMLVALFVSFVVYPKTRLQVFFTGLMAVFLAIPQMLYMGKPQTEFPFIHFGYLLHEPGFGEFMNYWVLNLGLSAILIPLGFLFSNGSQKKFLLFFLPLFLIGNVFQFSPEIAANHKFFNMFIIGGNIVTAGFIVKLWNNKVLGKTVAFLIFPLMVLSGVIDTFPIINDVKISIEDVENDNTSLFIAEKTPPGSVFLNTQYLYDPASLAGRKIYVGWPYFTWGAGYNAAQRDQKVKQMLTPNSLDSLCKMLETEKIDYIELRSPGQLIDAPIDYNFFEKNFPRIFFDEVSKTSIYKVIDTCSMPVSAL